MASGFRFAGFNRKLNPPPKSDGVTHLYTYNDGVQNISCWRLSPEELAHVMRTGEVWATTLNGEIAFPIFVSGLPLMESYDQDTGEPTTYFSDGRHIVENARRFATLHHGDQRYGEGAKPHTYHLAKVVQVLKDFEADWMYLAAGWLHDTEEDCWQDEPIEQRRERVQRRFTPEIEKIVWACTGQMFIDGVKQNRKARNIEQYAKIALYTMAAPCKYADRIANMEECVETKDLGLGQMYLGEAQDFDDHVGVHTPDAMRDRFQTVKSALIQMLNTGNSNDVLA